MDRWYRGSATLRVHGTQLGHRRLPGAPANQTAWLVGNSTNNGTDSANEPDYIFEPGLNSDGFTAPDQGGLHMRVLPGRTEGTATVTSHDYGGVANLRATLTFDGKVYDAVVTDEYGDLVKTPAGACGAKFAQHPFASLPVDQDCNGISDWWERDYRNTPGYSADADLDGGPGMCPGDGFTVRDEYRGFHYVADDWNENSPDEAKKRWASTDPTNWDIFFWDASDDGTADAPRTLNDQGESVPVFTQGVRDILGPKTPQTFFRRVNEVQANPVTLNQPADGVQKLNKNSRTVRTTFGYALDYFNAKPPDWVGPNLLGWSQDYGSKGQAVYVNNAGVLTRATHIDGAVLRAATLAHETGHVLGLCHYCDVLAFRPPPDNPPTLDFAHYEVGSEPDPFLGTVFFTYGTFNAYLSTTSVISQDLFDTMHYDLAGNALLDSSTHVPAVIPGPPGWPEGNWPPLAWVSWGAPLNGWIVPSAVVRNDWLNPITPVLGKIVVARQYGYLMDKVLRMYQPPDTGLQLKENWNWRGPSAQPSYAGDLFLMCGPACHGRANWCLQ